MLKKPFGAGQLRLAPSMIVFCNAHSMCAAHHRFHAHSQLSLLRHLRTFYRVSLNHSWSSVLGYARSKLTLVFQLLTND
jgi:hypothetical protein